MHTNVIDLFHIHMLSTRKFHQVFKLLCAHIYKELKRMNEHAVPGTVSDISVFGIISVIVSIRFFTSLQYQFEKHQ